MTTPIKHTSLDDLREFDAHVQRAVMDELGRDPGRDAAAIGVSVHHGVVALHGVVGCWAEKHAAGEAAHRVVGVRDVANDLEIEPSWCTERSDAEIAEAVRHALDRDGAVPSAQIQSTVSDGGRVTLTGAVATLAQRDAAARALRVVGGVRQLTNQITVEPARVAPDQLRAAICAALSRHVDREADRIAIAIDGDAIVLSGAVASASERLAVIGAARGTPGVTRIDDRLRIAP